MKNKESKDFIAYEYLSLNVKSEKESLYIDCYENFGWLFINNTALVDNEDYYLNHYYTSNQLINLKFKRNRRINNKMELLSLQRKLEITLKEIEKLENQPKSLGMIYSISVGMIGTIFLAFSVFAITATTPQYVISILCGAIGILGWIFPYFIYQHVKEKKTQENITLIDEKYNLVYESCEKARKLID